MHMGKRKPKTSVEAGQLADDYAQARKQNSNSDVSGGKVSHDARRGNDRQGLPPKRQQCGKLDHATRDCRSGGLRISNAEEDKPPQCK